MVMGNDVVALTLEGVIVVVILIATAESVVVGTNVVVGTLHGVWQRRKLAAILAAVIALVARRGSVSLAAEGVVKSRSGSAAMGREVGRVTQAHQLACDVFVRDDAKGVLRSW
jgi:hypothetical protein